MCQRSFSILATKIQALSLRKIRSPAMLIVWGSLSRSLGLKPPSGPIRILLFLRLAIRFVCVSTSPPNSRATQSLYANSTESKSFNTSSSRSVPLPHCSQECVRILWSLWRFGLKGFWEYCAKKSVSLLIPSSFSVGRVFSTIFESTIAQIICVVCCVFTHTPYIIILIYISQYIKQLFKSHRYCTLLV